MEIKPEQIRAARALLRLEQSELARRAGLSVVTIRRVEGAEGRGRAAAPTLASIHAALELAGVEFIPDGVRKRPVVRDDAQALYDDLRAISLQSAEQLMGGELLSDADLYDGNGLPG
ncbi:helix-turn-helix domain-containing protein [Rhodopila sp.]|uniref:helix-turn-helix domain-containing protein n=1 Tax=Rhodopila sp. TaxID=2480087 RepID=UPI003D0B92B6